MSNPIRCRLAAVFVVCALQPVAVTSTRAQTFFTEDFSNTGLLPGPNLEQSALNTAATFDGLVATFPGVGNAGRSYLRTLDDNYNTTSFTSEISVTLNGNGGPGIGFFGMGVGDPFAGFFQAPRTGSHVFMRAQPSDFGGGDVVLVDDGVVINPATTGEAGDGTHRLRVNYDAASQMIQFAIDQNYGGGLFQGHRIKNLTQTGVFLGNRCPMLLLFAFASNSTSKCPV